MQSSSRYPDHFYNPWNHPIIVYFKSAPHFCVILYVFCTLLIISPNLSIQPPFSQVIFFLICTNYLWASFSYPFFSVFIYPFISFMQSKYFLFASDNFFLCLMTIYSRIHISKSYFLNRRVPFHCPDSIYSMHHQFPI